MWHHGKGCYAFVFASVIAFTIIIYLGELNSTSIASASRYVAIPEWILRDETHEAYYSNTSVIHFKKDETHKADRSNIPVIHFVTPTYARLTQKAELTRVSAQLKLVPHLHWIVVEDSANKTKIVTNSLKTSDLNYTHLSIKTPKKPVKGHCISIARGGIQRNLALKWMRQYLNPDVDKGVVYFGDDDNTYSTEIFEEMRYTNKVSVWPVGLVGGLKYEGPIVKDGKVVDWRSVYDKNKRRYPIDMAGFAVNLKLILQTSKGERHVLRIRKLLATDVRTAVYANRSKQIGPTPMGFKQYSKKNRNIGFQCAPAGYAETKFLETVNITADNLEPKANNCTKVLVWHTQTKTPSLVPNSRLVASNLKPADPDIEV